MCLGYIQGDFCSTLNVSIIGFHEFLSKHAYSGVYLAMQNESTVNGCAVNGNFFLFELIYIDFF